MRSIVAFVAAVGFAVSCQAVDMEQQVPWSEDNALKMELTVLNPSNRNLNKIKLELKVTNTWTNKLVLDSELSVGFSLRFRTDLSEDFIFDEKKDVSDKEVSRLSKPGTNAVDGRFVVLQPGKSLSRQFDLAKPVRSVCQGHWSDRNMVHHGFYYEAMVRYRVPRRVKTLLIDAWYERGVWWMAGSQFEEWHGRAIKDVGLWDGRAGSNTVVVNKK